MAQGFEPCYLPLPFSVLCKATSLMSHLFTSLGLGLQAYTTTLNLTLYFFQVDSFTILLRYFFTVWIL